MAKYGVMTGTYYGPSGYQSYEGECDCEPGGLDKMAYNTILVLGRYNSGENDQHSYLSIHSFQRRPNEWTGYLHVWDRHVEKVSEHPSDPDRIE